MEKIENNSTVSNGNTNTLDTVSKKVKGLNFQLTLNDESGTSLGDTKANLLIKYLTNLKYRYIIGCVETNKKNFKHWHFYIQFNTTRKLSIKKCQGAHIEICRGTTQENIDYIKKDGNIIIELGTPKMNSYNNTINEIINCNNPNDLLNCDSKLFNIINNIKNNSILWMQDNINNPKNILCCPDFKLIQDKNSIKYKYAKKESLQWFGLSNNIIIDLNDYYKYDYDIEEGFYDIDLTDILSDKNKPINCKNQIYYPNDIKNIVFEFKDPYALKHLLRKHSHFIKNCNFRYENKYEIYTSYKKYLSNQINYVEELEDD